MNKERFLRDFHAVLAHHVSCVLKSGMLLDEDMSLLTTFWDPNFYQDTVRFDRRLLVTSAALTTVGLATTVKLNSIYPFLISALPTSVQLMSRSIVCYRTRRYKRRFERLLRLIKSTYSISKEIVQYYRKRDAAVKSRKLQVGAFNILVEPGEVFLKFAASSLHEVVDQIRNCMVQVCLSVPITEGDFVASIDWNLDDLRVTADFGFKEVRARFDKLSDLFLLITSNFLGCVGLSCCVQLWRERCDLPHVLDCLLPELVGKLDGLLNEVRAQFNRIRFNLCDGVIDTEGRAVRSSRLERPIMDLLLSLQITFETARRLQVLEAEGRTEECVTILDDVSKQLEESRDMLSILTRRFSVARPIPTKPPVEIVPLADDQMEIVDGYETDAELEDEEYNLSMHGSEPDDSPYLQDDADDSVENLGIVLLELKTKLLQDEGKVGKQAREELNRGDIVRSVPADEPPPRLPTIPDIGDVGGLVRAITFTARKLNRSEEVFGSGSISSCDSVESSSVA
uniref:Vezatin n=1 Tax=Photinus pyralis TaxID=7054 RepID=A0A1Y1K5K4_PHOPY